MKRIPWQIVPLAIVAMMIVGCNMGKTADQKQAEATEELMSEANRQIGLPNITHFTQKKTMKMIQEECDRADLICYAYLYVEMTGELKFLGKCIGYGVPFSAQYTNPMKQLGGSSAGVMTTIPQPDPNGLYMPTSSSATWLMMLDPDTDKPRVVYLEPNVIVSPFQLPEASYAR